MPRAFKKATPSVKMEKMDENIFKTNTTELRVGVEGMIKDNVASWDRWASIVVLTAENKARMIAGIAEENALGRDKKLLVFSMKLEEVVDVEVIPAEEEFTGDEIDIKVEG